MSATPATEEELDQAREKLASRLAEVLAQVDELTELAGSLKVALREVSPYPGEYPAGKLRVQISRNRRFSEPKGRELLRVDLHELVEKKMFDSAKYKALFPDLWEQAQDEYDNKVSLKVAPIETPAP